LKVKVSSPARLHFGILNPSELEGRGYGSVGLAIDRPRTVVEAEPYGEVKAEGLRTEDAENFARKITSTLGLRGVKLKVLSIAPVHVGLGSSTQLALSIAMATAKAHKLDLDPLEASIVMGRGTRSGVGTYAFKHGGFIVDGGRGANTSFPPLIFNHPFPEEWSFIVAIPKGLGLHGGGEAEAFRSLKPPKELIYRASYVILLKLIPALLEHDFESFSKWLTELQQIVGSMFSPAQGGVYGKPSQDAIEALMSLGIKGVGQSSWGPSVYGLVETKKAEELLDEAERALSKAEVFLAHPDNVGARVEVVG